MRSNNAVQVERTFFLSEIVHLFVPLYSWTKNFLRKCIISKMLKLHNKTFEKERKKYRSVLGLNYA